MMASKKIEITRLDNESKVLLLTILAQGYITAEQKQAFSSLLDVKTDTIFFVYSREQLEEIKRIRDEISDDMIRKNQLPDGYMSFYNSPTDEEINEALNRN